MNLFEAITTRKSVRTFNGLKLDDNIQASLRDYCNKLHDDPSLPSCFNDISRPDIIIAEDARQTGKLGTYGFITGARSFAIMCHGETAPEQLLAGYLFEKFVIECTSHGINTCWIGGTFSHSNFQSAYNRLASSGNALNSATRHVGIISPLGHGTHKTRFAERVMRRMVRSDHRHTFNKLFAGIEPPSDQLITSVCDGDTENLTINEAVKLALEMMRLAPSSSNSQPWRAMVETTRNGAVNFVAIECASANGFSNIDMGIGLYHFVASLEKTGYNGEMVLSFINNKPSIKWMAPSARLG